jgi:hypothetical protein
VVVAVMALGISSALAFGGSGRDDTARPYRCYNDSDGNADYDGTCDGVPLRPQDGTGNQYGFRAGDSDNDRICDYGNVAGSGRGGQCGRFR